MRNEHTPRKKKKKKQHRPEFSRPFSDRKRVLARSLENPQRASANPIENQTRNIRRGRNSRCVKTRGRFTAHGVAAQCATINHEFNFPPARSRARGAHKNRTNVRSRAANFSDNRAQAHTSIPCPFSPLGPVLSSFLLSLSLSVFSLSFLSFLPLSPSRHCGTCSTRLHAHIRTHITYLHRALSRKSCSTGAFFFRSLLPVPAPPFLLSSFLALTRSLFPVPPPPFLYLSNGPRFQRGPARVRAPGSFLARVCPGVTTRSLDIVSNFPFDFPASSRH